ncbi:MAG: CDP-diacylglycerol--serine O-phosphatidyltransferase [Bacteroidales bacterium]|nr:CDP-diacylglycerol--serine O-phosphatidyltransferase [Bacteroidales bacterium]
MTLRKYIPDFITSMNLVCGLIGVIFAIQSRLDYAFYCMLAAAVFDFLDGAAARLLDAYSDLGRELDSLCDLVSFGVLPGLMLCRLMQTFRFEAGWLCWLPLLLAVFSALRLAKFNVDPRQTEGFLGLPTPASALLCGALCCYCCHTPVGFLSTWAAGPVFLPLLTALLCVLLVCEVPMFSFKFHKGDGRTLTVKRFTLVAFLLAVLIYCFAAGHHWSLAVVLGFAFYILNNLVYALFRI